MKVYMPPTPTPPQSEYLKTVRAAQLKVARESLIQRPFMREILGCGSRQLWDAEARVVRLHTRLTGTTSDTWHTAVIDFIRLENKTRKEAGKLIVVEHRQDIETRGLANDGKELVVKTAAALVITEGLPYTEESFKEVLVAMVESEEEVGRLIKTALYRLLLNIQENLYPGHVRATNMEGL